MKRWAFISLAVLCAANPAYSQLKPDLSDNPLGFGSSHLDATLQPSQSFSRTPTSFGGGVVNFQSQTHPWQLQQFSQENNGINNSVASPESYVVAPMNFRSLGMNMSTQPMQTQALQPTGAGAYGMTRSISGAESGAGIAGMQGSAMIERLNSQMSTTTPAGAAGLGGYSAGFGLGGIGGGMGGMSGLGGFGGSSFGKLGF